MIFRLHTGLLALLISASSFAQTQLYTESFAPFSYQQDGVIKGKAVAIVRRMADEIQEPYQIKLWPWIRAYTKVKNTANTGLFLVAKTPAREKLFKWVGPIIEDHIYLCQRATASPLPYMRLDQLSKRANIAITRGFPEQEILQRHGFNNLKLTKNPLHALQLLHRGHADYVSCTPYTLPQLLKAASLPAESFQYTSMKVYQAELYLAFNQQTPDAHVEKWQHAMLKLQREGKLTSLTPDYIHLETPLENGH
ncbi:substrate-binding periplasmic protein [Motilimonas pumila]|uniref:Uncharacterized protein n=1 Tax=Motilimonas pumila TaxID=2303987 RepID=A0A418YDM1_9GAMM|nr:transporter substrate-binding domain-containing protein [Motilimonas pumila]RJG42604.1 hypothetical protein D1Z90_12100 [Motilimonas pumila]